MGPMALLSLQRKTVLWMFITHKNSLSSARPEPAAVNRMGPVAKCVEIGGDFGEK
jgi:hypothetical protein